MHACSDINYLDYVWRIIIGFGALPAVATIYLRSTLPETPRYTTDVSPQSPLDILEIPHGLARPYMQVTTSVRLSRRYTALLQGHCLGRSCWQHAHERGLLEPAHGRQSDAGRTSENSGIERHGLRVLHHPHMLSTPCLAVVDTPPWLTLRYSSAGGVQRHQGAAQCDRRQEQ